MKMKNNVLNSRLLDDSFEMEIEDIVFGGNGIGRVKGKVFFIPGVLKNEIVLARKTAEKKNFSKALPIKIIKASPERIPPSCPLAILPDGTGKTPRGFCPGCSYQHISYNEEIRIKENHFTSFISLNCPGSEKNILPPLPCPVNLNYRNKIVFKSQIDRGEVNLGYLMDDNQTVLDIPECPLANPEINKLLNELNKGPGFRHTLRDNMSLTFRHTENDGAVYWRNNPDKKDSWLKEKTVLGMISVPKNGFFQVNPCSRDILISKVSDILEKIKPGSVIDMYCGAGIFSIAAALKNIEKVIGIDSDEATIKAAEYNASTRNLKNCSFHAGDTGRMAADVFNKINPRDALLIIDPPRGGIDRRTAEGIERSGIKGIIYISCAPDTLGRDLKNILCYGYKIRSAQLIDMFPRTFHFESLTYLERD